jgi:hypothetical protein
MLPGEPMIDIVQPARLAMLSQGLKALCPTNTLKAKANIATSGGV